MVQESMGVPSTSTVQAPQDESSHPRLEPVRSSSRRSASSRSRFGSMAISYERRLTRRVRSCFFMKEALAASFWFLDKPSRLKLKAKSQQLPSIHRHLPIHSARPSVNPASHGLGFFKPLLTEPCGHIHGADTVMAISNDVRFRIEFLVGPAGDVAHRNQDCAFDVRGLELPRFTDVEQDERFFALRHVLDVFGSYFVIQLLLLFPLRSHRDLPPCGSVALSISGLGL